MSLAESLQKQLRFDINEFSGAFGDIGTALPLIIGMILASKLNVTSVLVVFGAMQLFSALFYGLPISVQPLKAVAVIVISQKIPAEVLYGGGFAIGLFMLFLTFSGLLEKIANIIPKVVVRGIQLGLGLQLSNIALKEYILGNSSSNYFLSIIAFLITIFLLGNRKIPPAPFMILFGFIYSAFFIIPIQTFIPEKISLPVFFVPSYNNMIAGFLLLALPQIPLSIGNSVLATKQVVEDLFPEKSITIKKIGSTYSIMNLINPFFSGIPTCHGSGGMTGHYAFGARTGGSVFIYGVVYILLGLFFGDNFEQIIKIFPLSILGVILLFESISLIILIQDVVEDKKDFMLALLIAMLANNLPYGYLIGMIVGTILYYLGKKDLTIFAKSK